MSVSDSATLVAGPYFDELRHEQVFTGPGLTVTCGHASAHQAILGDRAPLMLDHELGARVSGDARPLLHPNLVTDVAIGQSTVVTQRVIANLFYRDLAFHRAPRVGDTLRTTTEVVALKENRRPTNGVRSGLALLRVRTHDQDERPVLEFLRCAMLPFSPGASAASEHRDDIDAALPRVRTEPWAGFARDWDLKPLVGASGESTFAELSCGTVLRVEGSDVVSAAPELVRLTLNLAATHSDGSHPSGQRLVYGGHAIGLAAAQLARALPALAYIAGWVACDHRGPVFEGDRLRAVIAVEGREPFPTGGGLVRLRCCVAALRAGGVEEVLDWRPVVVLG